MRNAARKELARAILESLNAQALEVECGDCGTKQDADWKQCIVRNRQSWIAASKVECACGCTLYSYCGTSVPQGVLAELFAARSGEETQIRALRVFRESVSTYSEDRAARGSETRSVVVS